MIKVVQGYVVLRKRMFGVFFICINWYEKNEKQDLTNGWKDENLILSERSFSCQAKTAFINKRIIVHDRILRKVIKIIINDRDLVIG